MIASAPRQATHLPLLAPAVTVTVALAGAALAVAATLDPVLVAVGLAALLVVGLCLVRIELPLFLLVASGPLEGVTASGAESGLTATKAIGALCFASFGLAALLGRTRVRLDRSHAVVLGLLAIALVSSLGARELGTATATTARYASFVGLFIVTSQLARAGSVQRGIAWALSLASATAGALAIDRFVSGETTIASLAGTDPNDHAFILATTLPLTLWLLRERWALRPLVVLLVAVISASVALSFSRGALLGLGAAALWLVLVQRRHVRLLVPAILAAAVATLVFVQQNPEQVETGFAFKRNVASENVESRLEAWEAAAQLAVDHPLVGIGPGNFQFHYFEVTGRPPGTTNLQVVHNAYLDVASELGVLGLVLFVAYLVMSFLRARAADLLNLGESGLATAVQASLIVAAVAALTLTEQYFPPFWLLGGMATALWSLRAVPAHAPGREHG